MNNNNKLTRREIGWIAYDWANSAFITVVVTGFFPIYFKNFLGSAISAAKSTFWLGVGNSGSSLLLALLAPYWGRCPTAAPTRGSG